MEDIIDGDSVYTGLNDDLCWNSKDIFSWWFCLHQCLWKTLYSCWFTEVIEIVKVIDELTACPFGSLKRNCCYPGAIKVHQLCWSWSAIVGFTEKKKAAERCERPVCRRTVCKFDSARMKPAQMWNSGNWNTKEIHRKEVWNLQAS